MATPAPRPGHRLLLVNRLELHLAGHRRSCRRWRRTGTASCSSKTPASAGGVRDLRLRAAVELAARASISASQSVRLLTAHPAVPVFWIAWGDQPGAHAPLCRRWMGGRVGRRSSGLSAAPLVRDVIKDLDPLVTVYYHRDLASNLRRAGITESKQLFRESDRVASRRSCASALNYAKRSSLPRRNVARVDRVRSRWRPPDIQRAWNRRLHRRGSPVDRRPARRWRHADVCAGGPDTRVSSWQSSRASLLVNGPRYCIQPGFDLVCMYR